MEISWVHQISQTSISKFLLCRIFMVGVLCSARCCKLLLLSLLGQGCRSLLAAPTGFLTGSVQQVNKDNILELITILQAYPMCTKLATFISDVISKAVKEAGMLANSLLLDDTKDISKN